MSLIQNTISFSLPRDRRFSKPSAKVLYTDKVVTSNGSAVLGIEQSAVVDASSGVSSKLTDNTTGTAGSSLAPYSVATIATDFNNNFSSVGAQINNLVGDVGDIRSQLNDLLAAMRTFGAIDS